VSLKEALKCSDEAFLDFLEKCFIWEPEKRMTPEEGLKHPWITGEGFKKGSHPIRLSLVQNRFPMLYRTHRKLEEDKLNKTSIVNPNVMIHRGVQEEAGKEMQENMSSSNPNNSQLLYRLFNKMRTKEQSTKNKHQLKKSAII